MSGNLSDLVTLLAVGSVAVLAAAVALGLLVGRWGVGWAQLVAGMVISAGVTSLTILVWSLPRYWWLAVPPLYLGLQALRVWRRQPLPALRLRLSALFLIVVAAMLFAGGIGNLWRHLSMERRLAEELSPWIDIVTHDFDGAVTGVVLKGADDSVLERLAPRLAKFPSLRQVQIVNQPVTDRGVAHLAGLRRLQMLSLQGTQVGDAGMRHVSELARLRQLDLIDTRVGDGGLTLLGTLTQLERVWISGTRVTPQGIRQLRDRLPRAVVE